MKIDFKELEVVVKNSTSYSEVCRKMNLSNNGYTFSKIKKIVESLDINVKHFTGGAKKDYDIKKLEKLVKSSTTYSEVCRGFGIKESGGNIRTIKKRIKENNLDISHFEGKAYTGKRRESTGQKQKELSDILVENSDYSRAALKRRLINEGVLEYKCFKCVNKGVWMGEELVLQLDHINGVRNDNRLENLRFLCPNCHSQTKTYAGKNNNE